MNQLQQLIDVFLHLDVYLADVIAHYGAWTYGVLFTIIFCETGLIVTPILPGDSLLFAIGSMAAIGALNPHLVVGLLTVAAILGDSVNYFVGRRIGPKVFHYENSRIFKKEYLERTQSFFEKYGGKTIVLARFVPIVRTFAPFVAGVGAMNYPRFFMYNVIGAIVWVTSLVYAGYFFGNIPLVKKNFEVVILGIIFLSILPAIIEFLKARRQATALAGSSG